jgi:hypothetical protein
MLAALCFKLAVGGVFVCGFPGTEGEALSQHRVLSGYVTDDRTIGSVFILRDTDIDWRIVLGQALNYRR